MSRGGFSPTIRGILEAGPGKLTLAINHNTLVYRCSPPLAFIELITTSEPDRAGPDMASELAQVCQLVRQEPKVLVVVLSGRGQVFSSSVDRLDLGPDRREGHTPIERIKLHRAASHLASIEVPTIAAIGGDALDHGLELALACDLRVVSKGVKLGFTGLSRGVIPWDGGTQRLPRLVGRTLALEMLLTCRMLESHEAFDAGLVNLVVEPEDLMDRTLKLAHKIASGAPIAARYAKEAVLKGMDMSLEGGLRLEADLNIILQSTDDRAEGIAAFLEKREPGPRGV